MCWTWRAVTVTRRRSRSLSRTPSGRGATATTASWGVTAATGASCRCASTPCTTPASAASTAARSSLWRSRLVAPSTPGMSNSSDFFFTIKTEAPKIYFFGGKRVKHHPQNGGSFFGYNFVLVKISFFC